MLATNGWELSPRETLRRREHGAEQGKPPWQISIKTEQPFRVERPGSGTRRPSNQSVPAVTGGAISGRSWACRRIAGLRDWRHSCGGACAVQSWVHGQGLQRSC